MSKIKINKINQRRFNNVVLLAHNGRKFDFSVVATAFENWDLLTFFFDSVRPCVDSLSVF